MEKEQKLVEECYAEEYVEPKVRMDNQKESLK